MHNSVSCDFSQWTISKSKTMRYTILKWLKQRKHYTKIYNNVCIRIRREVNCKTDAVKPNENQINIFVPLAKANEMVYTYNNELFEHLFCFAWGLRNDVSGHSAGALSKWVWGRDGRVGGYGYMEHTHRSVESVNGNYNLILFLQFDHNKVK